MAQTPGDEIEFCRGLSTVDRLCQVECASERVLGLIEGAACGERGAEIAECRDPPLVLVVQSELVLGECVAQLSLRLIKPSPCQQHPTEECPGVAQERVISGPNGLSPLKVFAEKLFGGQEVALPDVEADQIAFLSSVVKTIGQ